MRLINDDCLKALDTLEPNSVDLCLTDMPYNITNCDFDKHVIDLAQLWPKLLRVVKENGAILLFGNDPFSTLLKYSNLKMFKYNLVWAKTMPTGFLNAKKQPLKAFEQIHVFYRKPPTYNPIKRGGG